MEGIRVEEALTEEMVRLEADRQMRIIKKGAAEVIGEEELRTKLERSIGTGKPLTVKFGMDPSAPDLHLGHAVALRKLRQLQDLGHRIVVVIGEFTGRIGDPTGKSKGRKALTDKEVLLNAQTYQEQMFCILDQDKTEVRFNGEWLELLQLEEALRLASTMTVARMLERDDFQNRYTHGTPIGLHEFFYPLMQAYDSVALEADLELGGTDQTFNVLMGRQLQRDWGMEPQAAVFMPILEGLDGVEKMSKSLGNHIGVLEDARSMYKKIMEVPDRLIARYFELATDILPQELERIKEELADGCNPRDMKLRLASAVTGLYHSKKESEEAERFYQEAFAQKAIPAQADGLQVVMERGNLYDVIPALLRDKLIESGSGFRRLLSQGGISLNGERAESLESTINTGDVLKVGKKLFVRLELV